MQCLASWFEPTVRIRIWGPVLRIDEGWGRNRFSKPVLKHSATLARCRDTRKRKCDWRQVMPVNGRLWWSVVVWTAFRLESFVWAECKFIWQFRIFRLDSSDSVVCGGEGGSWEHFRQATALGPAAVPLPTLPSAALCMSVGESPRKSDSDLCLLPPLLGSVATADD